MAPALSFAFPWCGADTMSNVLHAGLMAIQLGGYWRGVLITGPSGSGKSDLALRLMQAGYRLVADDRVVIWASGGVLFGRSPYPGPADFLLAAKMTKGNPIPELRA